MKKVSDVFWWIASAIFAIVLMYICVRWLTPPTPFW